MTTSISLDARETGREKDKEEDKDSHRLAMIVNYMMNTLRETKAVCLIVLMGK